MKVVNYTNDSITKAELESMLAEGLKSGDIKQATKLELNYARNVEVYNVVNEEFANQAEDEYLDVYKSVAVGKDGVVSDIDEVNRQNLLILDERIASGKVRLINGQALHLGGQRFLCPVSYEGDGIKLTPCANLNMYNSTTNTLYKFQVQVGTPIFRNEYEFLKQYEHINDPISETNSTNREATKEEPTPEPSNVSTYDNTGVVNNPKNTGVVNRQNTGVVNNPSRNDGSKKVSLGDDLPPHLL